MQTRGPSGRKRLVQWVLLIAVIGFILLLLRLGMPAIAAILSGFLGLTAIISRLMVLAPLWRHASRYRQKQTAAPASSTMTREQAAAILGITPDATTEEIKAAYHRLMRSCHPDAGGNDYLAAQLNQAKEVLLNTKGTP